MSQLEASVSGGHSRFTQKDKISEKGSALY
jgi:hypothetical protein